MNILQECQIVKNILKSDGIIGFSWLKAGFNYMETMKVSEIKKDKIRAIQSLTQSLW